MLVKFHSSSSGEIMMFAETARTLLGVLKKECTARGVVTLEELPERIALLQAAIECTAESSGGAAASEAVDANEPLPIGFRQRATPFLELLQRTLSREGYVLWEAPEAFEVSSKD